LFAVDKFRSMPIFTLKQIKIIKSNYIPKYIIGVPLFEFVMLKYRDG